MHEAAHQMMLPSHVVLRTQREEHGPYGDWHQFLFEKLGGGQILICLRNTEITPDRLRSVGDFLACWAAD